MMEKMNIKNSVIKKYIDSVEILSTDYPAFFQNVCNEFSIPLNKDEFRKTFISWQHIPNHYEFFYDNINSEERIVQWLEKTPIAEYENLIIEFGYMIPILLINRNVFIGNWYDFLSANGYAGITCLTPDGQYYMEFGDDSDYLLRSNFIIHRD